MTAHRAPKKDGRVWHDDPGDRDGRVKYVLDLMASLRYRRGITDRELAEDWGLALVSAQGITAEASRHLRLLNGREEVIDKIRIRSDQWVDEAGADRVQAARLLIDTVGGFPQKHEIRHEYGGLTTDQILERTVHALVLDEDSREFVRAALAAADAGLALPRIVDTTGEETEAPALPGDDDERDEE